MCESCGRVRLKLCVERATVEERTCVMFVYLFVCLFAMMCSLSLKQQKEEHLPADSTTFFCKHFSLGFSLVAWVTR